MATVVVVFRIYPKEQDQVDRTLSDIKTKVEPKPVDIRSEEVAFGIKLVRCAFKFEDKEMGSSKIEDQIKKLDSVGEVEVEEETLL
jgi:translation elongation factor EF-1beta